MRWGNLELFLRLHVVLVLAVASDNRQEIQAVGHDALTVRIGIPDERTMTPEENRRTKQRHELSGKAMMS